MPLGISQGLWTLLTILFGGVVTLGGTLLVNWYKFDVESRRLQSALATEMELMTERIEILLLLSYFLAESDDDLSNDDFEHVSYSKYEAMDTDELREEFERFSPTSNPFSARIYSANTNNLGRLDKDAASDVVKFYSNIEAINRTIRAVNSNWVTHPSSIANDLYTTLKSTREFHENLLDELEEDGLLSRVKWKPWGGSVDVDEPSNTR